MKLVSLGKEKIGSPDSKSEILTGDDYLNNAGIQNFVRFMILNIFFCIPIAIAMLMTVLLCISALKMLFWREMLFLLRLFLLKHLICFTGYQELTC